MNSERTLELAPEDRENKRRIVAFGNGAGQQLVGTLHLAGGKPARGAVLVHGWSGDRAGPNQVLLTVAETLAAAGLPALRFDLRGRGDSEGEAAQTDLDDMIDDAAHAACFLARETSAGEVVAVGLCSGGNVAIGAATLLPELIRRVVPISTLPFQSEREAALDKVRRSARRREALARLFRRESWRKLLGGELQWRRILRNLGAAKPDRAETRARAPIAGQAAAESRNLKDSSRDLPAAFAAYRGQVLFIYGGADQEGARASEHFRGRCAAGRIPARFVTVPGANHNFYSAAWQKRLAELVVAFARCESSAGT